MPPKSTAGYTKAAQKVKYVRNRDIKLSGKEQKEEQRIQQGMSEGICVKCREKLQWRFQFNKYKPLKSIANCSGCSKKCITKAYRTLCDNCANERKVCPGCCQDPYEILERSRAEELKKSSQEVKQQNPNETLVRNEGEEDDMEEVVELIGKTETPIFTPASSEWNSRKFDDFAAAKYSKNRVTGSTEDQLFGAGDIAQEEGEEEGEKEEGEEEEEEEGEEEDDMDS